MSDLNTPPLTISSPSADNGEGVPAGGPRGADQEFLPYLRRLLESKKDGIQDLHSATDAVVLVTSSLVNAPEREQANKLVLDWVDALNFGRQTLLDSALARTQVEFVQKRLVDLGANPNGWLNNGNGYELTSLAEAYAHSLVPSVATMLGILSERDEVPLLSRKEAKPGARRKNKAKNLFEKFAEEDSGTGFWMKQQVLDHLLKMDLPRSWRWAAASALNDYLPKKKTEEHSEALKVEIGLLAIAEFDRPEDWLYILSCGKHKGDLPRAIAGISWKMPDQVTAIASNVIAAGVHLDDIATYYETPAGEICNCTWLKAAVHCNNASLVQQLLEGGADPTNTYPRRAIGIINAEEAEDAFTTAAKYNATDSLRVLEAWRARQAVEGVLKRHQAAKNP